MSRSPTFAILWCTSTDGSAEAASARPSVQAVAAIRERARLNLVARIMIESPGTGDHHKRSLHSEVSEVGDAGGGQTAGTVPPSIGNSAPWIETASASSWPS